MSTATDADEGRMPAVRLQVLIPAAVALAGLLVAAVLWLPGDSTSEVAAAAETTADGEAPSAPADAEATTEPEALPVVTYEVYLDRDPFDPVVPEPQPEPTSTGADGDVQGAGDGDPAVVDEDADDVTEVPGPTTGNEECFGGSEEIVCDGAVLTLVEILGEGDERLAVIRVGTEVYEVGVGDGFAQRFRLLEILDDQVIVQFGDEIIVPGEGEQVMK